MKSTTLSPCRLRDFAVLAALALLFFAELLMHPTQVLYSDHSDMLAETLPAKRFLVRSWQQTGEVPLWCPYSYGGMPFVHDIKVAALYPLHLPLYLLPEETLGPVLSWLVVLHVFAAGACMYTYARSRGLLPTPALVAGIGFMFAGKWLLHILAAGQYVLTPLAWLPLVLLALEKAILHGSIAWATFAGAIFGVIVLGCHPQGTMYAGVFVAVWSLGAAMEKEREAGSSPFAPLLLWLGFGLWTAVVAAAVAAVELVPAVEAMTQATRGAGVPSGWTVTQPFLYLFDLIGVPDGGARWESVGGIGVIWLGAAVLAIPLVGGRTWFQAGVGLALVLFALGGGEVLQLLPGFHLFQIHSRMLLMLAIPVSLLAAETTQTLLSRALLPTQVRRLRLLFLSVVLFAALLVAGRCAVVGDYSELLRSRYWVTILVMAPLAVWVLGRLEVQSLRLLWLGILFFDLLTLTQPLVAVRIQDCLFERSPAVRFLQTKLAENKDRHDRVLDRRLVDRRGRQEGEGQAVIRELSAWPLGTALPFLLEIETLRGYNSVDVQRYKEYLKLITNDPTPQIPRDARFGFPILDDFPIINKPLLDLLGVRYLLEPSDPLHCPFDDVEREPTWSKVFAHEHAVAHPVIGGGMPEVPDDAVYENRAAFPRAFVVAEASPLPQREFLLGALITTDFRNRVLLEDSTPGDERTGPGAFRPLAIREYLPNRIVVDADKGPAGYLVLADVWFPGWICAVDGKPAPIRRANFLFRAVKLPAGAQEVVFTFAPRSYYWGKLISAGACLGIVLLFMAAFAWRFAGGRAAARRIGNSGT